MPSLWDVANQSSFADSCVRLEAEWANLIPAVRQTRFNNAVNELARQIQMPEFAFHYSDLGDSTMGNLDFTTWRLNMNSRFTLSPHAGGKDYMKFCSTLYHEAHHGEQWFRCVQGVAKGVLPLPLLGRSAQRVNASVKGYDAQTIADYMWVPVTVANRAQATRMMYPTTDHATIKRWYDSIYGIQSAYRNKVLSTLSHGIEVYKKYLALPEEVDAWNLERQFRALLKQKSQAAGADWAMQHLGDLFS